MQESDKSTFSHSATGVGDPLTPAADAYQVISVSHANAAGVAKLPIYPERIARVYGVQFYGCDLPLSISGYLDRDDQGTFIVLNQWLKPGRKRFVIAREFGRYYYTRQGRAQSPVGTDVEKVYANRFATALLMPAEAVKSKFEQLPDVGVMARLFNVSEDAMEVRLKGLGLVSSSRS